ncbi:hypothetical protein PybrP1_008763 [[Pythium] brassicae (nom. inval.)]|nr:hypothetical protein PybrP1_008763 [[Pythium] brassicae (nom. inval.)]
MQERERPRFTLFTQADAEAMTLRERSSTATGAAIMGAALPPPAPKYFQNPPASAASFSMRPSQTFYGGRESYGGGDTDASVESSSVADGSSGSSQQHAPQGSRSSSSAAGGGGRASASTTTAPAGSRARVSVCVDASHTFEDMFETDWEGYLWKQGHVVRSWRYRYAVLAGTTLTYYVSKDVAVVDTEKFRGRVTVTGARPDDARANGVLVTTTIGKVFAVYTRSPAESEIWVRMIQQAVAHASDPKPSLSASATTRTSGGGASGNPNGRDSDWQALAAAGGRHTLATNAILAQSVRSSLDWKTRNLGTVKQFYALWAAQLLEPRGGHASAAHLLALFPLCSTDMVLTVRYPCEFLPSAPVYGREGLVDVALALTRVLQFRRFAVSRFLSTKHPHVLQVLATGKLWNKALQREFAFTTRDELQLSPGGRVLSAQLQIDVDLAAFTVSDAERKALKAERVAFQATTSKRVLSLSIQHFHVNRVLGKGTFGTVVLAERKSSGEVFAVKILEKSSMSNYDKLRTKTEMRILRDVHHPFIAPLRFSFQSHSRVFLGMEYYPGGSLYTHMNRFTNNKEHRIKIAVDLARVRFYAAQIVLALCHLHACDIVYRCLIEKDPVKFPPKCAVPAEARNLIVGLLEKDPTKRLGARQASEILTHPFFRDVKWELVLRKKVLPPWVPAPLSLAEERLKNPDINYDKYLASKTYSTGSFFSMIFPWRSPHSRARRKPERDNDTFGKFSYVSDTTNSFLVDEDEMLDSAFTGRRSIQLQGMAADA